MIKLIDRWEDEHPWLSALAGMGCIIVLTIELILIGICL